MTLSLCDSLVALTLVCCMRAAAQPAPEPTCPTCAARGESIDSGAAGGSSALVVHCADEATLTAAVAEEFALESLQTYIEQSNVVTGYFGGEGGIRQTAPPAEQSAPVELRFDVGQLSYYKKTVDADAECDDTIWASAHVFVRIGNGLLSFEADGRLRQRRHEPSALFSGEADLATATGSYRPNLDPARPHIGKIFVVVRAAPGHLRGDITPAVFYFRDEAQLRRYQQGAWDQYAELRRLFRLRFPRDRCQDYELPFAHDEAIERLGGRSADEWRERVIGLIGVTAVVDAVWEDDRETEVAVELGEHVVDTACLSSYPRRATELELRIPLAGRLRSTDARLDIPLDDLVVGIDSGAVARVTLRSRVPSATLSAAQREALGTNAEVFLARLDYDLGQGRRPPDGIVELLARTAPNSTTRVGCIAFPPGGKADTGTCRYRR